MSFCTVTIRRRRCLEIPCLIGFDRILITGFLLSSDFVKFRPFQPTL